MKIYFLFRTSEEHSADHWVIFRCLGTQALFILRQLNGHAVFCGEQQNRSAATRNSPWR